MRGRQGLQQQSKGAFESSGDELGPIERPGLRQLQCATCDVFGLDATIDHHNVLQVQEAFLESSPKSSKARQFRRDVRNPCSNFLRFTSSQSL